MRPTILLIPLALLGAACRRPNAAADLTPPPSRETVRNLPRWYLKPPQDDKFAFGTATAVSQDLQVSIDKAQAAARNVVAQQLEVKYGALTKRFARPENYWRTSAICSKARSIWLKARWST